MSRFMMGCALAFALSACSNDQSPISPTGSSRLASAAGSDIPVTTTVADNDAAVAPSLQYRSDGGGSYVNSRTLTSVIQSVGAWVLDSKNPKNATRRVYIDFSQPVAGSAPGGGNPPTLASGTYLVRMIAKCNLTGIVMQSMLPGATAMCPLHTAFDIGSASYALQMNPVASAGDPDGAPETNFAAITCTTPASGPGPCTGWRITPSGTYTAPDGSTRYQNVARLIKYVTTGHTTTPVNQGDFLISFAITATKP